MKIRLGSWAIVGLGVLLGLPVQSALAQGKVLPMTELQAAQQAAELKRFTKVYRGSEAASVRTSAEKLGSGRLRRISQLTKGLSSSDSSLLALYVRDDEAFLSQAHSAYLDRHAAICAGATYTSGAELMEQLLDASDELVEANRVHYEELLGRLSRDGRSELLRAADEFLSNSTLVRRDQRAMAKANPGMAAREAKNVCLRPPPPQPSPELDDNTFLRKD